MAKPTGWFIVNWLFFWPSAIYSLVSHWQKIDPSYYAGDLAGAQAHARKVRNFGVFALCLSLGIMVFYVILAAVFVGTMTTGVTIVNR